MDPTTAIDVRAALSIATKAAEAGAQVLQYYARHREQLQINFKMRNDLVSQADQEAEQAIIEVLQKLSPDFGIIAEESGGTAQGQAFWVIDPLDGTTNFLHGIPHYAVSIALVARAATTMPGRPPLSRTEPVAGLVYDPNRNEYFSALYGQGAWLNQERMYCSQTETLTDALVATGFPFRDFGFADQYMPMMQAGIQQTRGLRRLGSAALDLAWVAAGRFDAYWEMGLAPWDVAAGTLIAREAGAHCADLYHEEHWPASGDIYCAPPALAQVMHQELIAPHLGKRTAKAPDWYLSVPGQSQS